VTCDDLEEMLETQAPLLNDFVTEPVCKDFSRERGDRDSRAFAFQDVPEILKVAISSPHHAVFEFERWNIRPTHDFVVCKHLTPNAVRLGASDFDFEEVLWWAVDFVKGLFLDFRQASPKAAAARHGCGYREVVRRD